MTAGEQNIVVGTRSGDIYFVGLDTPLELANKDPDIRDHMHKM